MPRAVFGYSESKASEPGLPSRPFSRHAESPELGARSAFEPRPFAPPAPGGSPTSATADPILPIQRVKAKKSKKTKTTGSASRGIKKSNKTQNKYKKRSKYHVGQHGAKTIEQKRLTEDFTEKVTGKTHESEHPIGYEPLARHVDETLTTPKETLLRAKPSLKKPKKPKDPNDLKAQKKYQRALENHPKNLEKHKERLELYKKQGEGRGPWLEKHAPAYQEEAPMHRAHVGTGTGRVDRDEKDSSKGSHFTDKTYRDTQRELVKSGDISSAVQINQLVYAFMPGFQRDPKDVEDPGLAANDSYDKMVENLSKFTYAKGDQDVDVDVDGVQRGEMYLSRRAAQTGKWPTEEEIKAAKEKFGVKSEDKGTTTGSSSKKRKSEEEVRPSKKKKLDNPKPIDPVVNKKKRKRN